MAIDNLRILEAKGKGIMKIAEDLGIIGLKRAGREWTGPCPKCGGDDRFSINWQKELYMCRGCGAKGDAIGLVQFDRELSFTAALDWLLGPEQTLTPEERAKREKAAADNEAQKKAKAEKYRLEAIRDARTIWTNGLLAVDSPVVGYLAARGITRALLPKLPACLRYAPDLPYMVKVDRHEYVEVHRGPAMLAAVQGRDDKFSAVHRTWFDLSSPQGKVEIRHPVTGELQKRKKGLGSKKGGTIRLIKGTAPVLVMGEGIETTLTAAVSGIWPEAHFWAGVDLGNMAGRRETDKGLKFAGIPDLDDPEAFVPPPWVQLLIYVMDGDSDPRLTRAQLEAGLRRAMVKVPGLKGQIAVCPQGKDLNDLLMEGARDE